MYNTRDYNNDWLETRDEWELELEKGQNRGKRKKLDYDDECDFDEDLDDDLGQEWFENDLAGLPSDQEEDFSWDDL